MRRMQEFFWGMSQKGLMGNVLFPAIQTLVSSKASLCKPSFVLLGCV